MRQSEQLLRDIAEVRRFNQLNNLLNFIIDEREEGKPWILVPKTKGIITCAHIINPPFLNGKEFEAIFFSSTENFNVQIYGGRISYYSRGRAAFSTGEKPHYALGAGYNIQELTEMIRQVG